MEKNDILIQNIKKLRRIFNYTQDSVASYLGETTNVYSNYECGRTIIPIKYLERLSNLYGIEIKSFFEEEIFDEKLMNKKLEEIPTIENYHYLLPIINPTKKPLSKEFLFAKNMHKRILYKTDSYIKTDCVYCLGLYLKIVKKEEDVYAAANFISLFFFYYLMEIIYDGFQKGGKLELSDIESSSVLDVFRNFVEITKSDSEIKDKKKRILDDYSKSLDCCMDLLANNESLSELFQVYVVLYNFFDIDNFGVNLENIEGMLRILATMAYFGNKVAEAWIDMLDKCNEN